ncbi:11518_t:CDS:2 [Acaulospora colombiana]|uniref:11518_t:CDS:1 n=1 Tax=Acaulospora colombiana TaxID=27376 RepID=A0ACA9JUW4_9GLOM|nr:11518_t:CDS:2 [Acaulospora colombiana]
MEEEYRHGMTAVILVSLINVLGLYLVVIGCISVISRAEGLVIYRDSS